MNKTNSLIESPTGTGKTLVLLCSTLAWLKKSEELSRPYMAPKLLEKIARERLEMLAESKCTCGLRANKADLEQHAKEKGKGKEKGKVKDEIELDLDIYSEGDSCQQLEPSKYFQTDEHTKENDEKKEEKMLSVEIIDLTADKDDELKNKTTDDGVKNKSTDGEVKPKQLCKTCKALAVEQEYSKILATERDEDSFIPNHYRKVPRIFYGTRTHKQVSQVVRELNKTVYCKKLRMCILSSRERTCINPAVKDLPNRDEACRERLKVKTKSKEGESCAYKTDTLDSAFEGINDDFYDRAWDIEEVNKWGQEKHLCPYFGCRSLQDGASITFCPYNYLLDARIRRSLNINLKNSIIIFDEAHNIEDICRDAASFMLDSTQIDDILNAINIVSSNYTQGSDKADAYQFFRDKFFNLKSVLHNFDFGPQYESSNSFVARKILSQQEMLVHLKQCGLGPDCLEGLVKNFSILKEGDDKSSSQDSILDLSEVQHITQLTATLEFMYSDKSKNIDDYRCVITKSLVVDRNNFRKSKRDRAEPESMVSNFVTQMSLLCMSPAIAFKKIHSEAWSVIVASGTLSPIESLETELGCEFVTPFQGGHVIPEDRVLATVLSRGPNGEDLNCSFTNSMSFKFQDEVGAVVRDVCKTVPNGVLCFFPSYDRLDGLYQRWMTKGYIAEIQKAGKRIHREDRKKTPQQFELELGKYNANANNRGALLLAVYRGKVSEGIDFADKAARAVITIGIPFPNVKEVTISLKRDYNDIARRQRPQLLPGSDWYTSQAFRALNQAVGRCIRHRNDWGAIIMIDSRLRQRGTLDHKISKWLQRLVLEHSDYRVVKDCLVHFVSTRVQEEGASNTTNKRIKLETIIDLDDDDDMS